MTSRFEGRGVLVTGGARGIGRAIVAAFVTEGARVVATDVLGEGLDLLRVEWPTVDTLAADLAFPEAARAVVPQAVGRLDRLHVLVNCAGVQPDGPALDVTLEEFDHTIAVNTRAPFILMQEACRHFLDHDGGVIVNVSSANAIRNESPESVYNASKAALIALTRAFAHEFGHLGIRVNCIAPGETMTPEAQAEMSEDDLRTVRDYLQRVPMRRAGRPEEQAAAVLFLASGEASFVTGQTLVVDGGELTGDWYDVADRPPTPGDVL